MVLAEPSISNVFEYPLIILFQEVNCSPPPVKGILDPAHTFPPIGFVMRYIEKMFQLLNCEITPPGFEAYGENGISR